MSMGDLYKFPYIDLNNGSILDRVTGAIWQQEPPELEMDIDEVQEYLFSINADSGEYNWRLPDVNEIKRLLTWINLNLELAPLLFRCPYTCQYYLTSNIYSGFVIGRYVIKANTLDICEADLIIGPRTTNLIWCIHSNGEDKNVSNTI